VLLGVPLGVAPFHPYKIKVLKRFINIRALRDGLRTVQVMALQHVSSILPSSTNNILGKISHILWKNPGEKNFKFDYIRVLKETEMPPHLKYTALHLATSFYTGGNVGISFKTLARHMGVTPRTVQNNVNALLKLGWITRTSGRVGVVNQYQGLIPSHLPSVAAAMERLQEKKRKQLAKKMSDVPTDLVVRFIARMYMNKELGQYLEQDLIEMSMNVLRRTVTTLLNRSDAEYQLAHHVLEKLSTWPLPEKIGSRPHMFDGALNYLVPNLHLAHDDDSVPLFIRQETPK